MSALLALLATLLRVPALLMLDEPDPEGLGEAGKRALDKERTDRKAAEKTAKEEQKRASDALAELERLRDGQRTESERAVSAARADGEKAGRDAAAAEFASQRAQLLRDRVGDRVALAANGRLADPAAAAGFLNLDSLVGDDGQPDDAKINTALDALVGQQPVPPTGGGSAPPASPAPPPARGYGVTEQGARPPAPAGDRADRVKAALETVKQRTGIA